METKKIEKTTKVVTKRKSPVKKSKEKIVIENKIINEDKVNANLSRRLSAYIIDMLIISFILFIFGLALPYGDKVKTMEKEVKVITQQYMDKKIDADTFNNKITPINYNLAKEMYASSVISVIVIILYFVLYQFKYKATIGKKIMGIVIIKDKGELQIKDLFYRSLIINSVFSNLFALVILLLLNKDSYSILSSSVYMAQYLFIVVTISYIMFRKDRLSLHDIITKTRVVEV